MTEITIDGKKYEARDNDKEVLLEDAIKIGHLKVPKNLRKFYDFLIDEKKKQPKFNDNDLNVLFPKFAKKVIAILTNIPEKVINDLTPEERLGIYNEVLEDQVFSILYEGCKHTVENIKSFDLGGVKYHLPDSTMIMKKERPMFKEPFITWSEVDDLMKASRQMTSGLMESAKHVVSIIARPKGEVYDEATSLARADLFLKLPMSVVWEVFFCTVKLLNTFSLITAYKEANKQRSKLKLVKSVTSGSTVG